MHDVSLSVVIPTYRRATRLHRLLTALEAQITGKPDRQVVVVNDGSHDDAYAKVVERFQTMIDYVALPQNRGRAAARNAGVRKATGRYLVFTDDDCVPPPHWLDWLVAVLEEYPYAAVVGGPTRLLQSETPSLLEQYATTWGFGPKPLFEKGQLYCVPTANVAIRRDWFDKVGGFDERFNGGEDTNLTLRLIRAGAHFHLDWSWFTHHGQDWSLRDFCERWFRYGRGRGQQWELLGEFIGIFSPPSSVWSILRGLPKTVDKVRRRHRTSGQRGYRRLIFSAFDLVRFICFDLGLMVGDRLAARIGDRSAGASGN